MLLKEIQKQIQNEGYFVGTWDLIEEAINFYIDTSSGINQFKELLSDSGLECFPKLVNGTVANLEKSLAATPLVIFNEGIPLQKNRSDIQYALLVGKIASVMAKVDGEVDQEEIRQIRKNIYKLSFLSESEKYRVFIRSVYALHLKSPKEELMQGFSKLSAKAKKQALSIAQDIAISDHYIDRSEILFLTELYRLSDIPTNTMTKDLREHAKSKNVVLDKKNRREAEVPEPELVIELDDSFEEMLSEFENF
jgi:tellurite resistance protein